MDVLEAARAAFDRRDWQAAYAAFSAARAGNRLGTGDWERFAISAHLAGCEAESREALTGGFRAAAAQGEAALAARFAFFAAHSLLFSGEFAQANGWCARAQAMLAGQEDRCVEWGYLLIPRGVQQLAAGDHQDARGTFAEALRIGRRFNDDGLVAAAGHGLGRALIHAGLRGEGLAVLDEVMVTVSSGDVTPLLVGHLYCGVLEACQELYDVRRAREWTAMFTRWCEGQAGLVPFRGPCLVHRAELMRLHGDWEDALAEARRACEWLSTSTGGEGPGDALYQLGELYRLRGEYPSAEGAYREASRQGRAPHPGLALLWLARGQPEAAAAALRRALDELEPPGAAGEWERVLLASRRTELLAAFVEVQLAGGELEAAREGAEQLAEAARQLEALPVRAMADRAAGSVLIAEGRPRDALATLRRSWSAWTSVGAPYEAARVRVLVAAACRALGDHESAEMELDAARWVFERVGASPELALLRPGRLSNESPAGAPLTPRELEVLGLVAAGATNKGIAASLVISEHTAARHVQNILQKLGFSSRAALAAFAVKEGLAAGPGGQD
nr:LuxR family transcriptional regulator [Tepidiforma sp.]